MRVGLIIYGSLATVSGGYLYDRHLVDHLRRQGDQVEIIALPGRDYARHLGDNLSAALTRRLRHARLDLLLQDELTHPSLFWLNRHRRGRPGYPIVSIVHHLRCCEARPVWQNHGYRWVERRYLARVDAFVFNSRTTRAAVEGLVGDRRPATVAYPAGDRFQPVITPARIQARARQPGPLRLLFIGNLIPRKGLHTLIEALARLNRPDWRLTVAGNPTTDPAYAATVRRQIEQAGLGRQVALLGALADDDLAACLADSHLLAVPSSYEGYGIVYVEAMGFGLPVIGSTAGAAHEIVSHDRDGFLIQPGDAAALAGYIQALIDDRARLVALSLAARARYAAHPTWAVTTDQIRSFLETVVSASGNGRPGHASAP